MYKPKLLTAIVRMSRIKEIVIDKETVYEIVSLLTNKMTYGEFEIRFKIKKKEIDLTDTVTELYNNQVIALGLHPIERMIDISKWPRKAIMSWAKDHLKLGTDSIKCMYDYNYFSDTSNKNLVDLLQKHHTYNAGKSKQLEQEDTLELIKQKYAFMNDNIINTHGSDTIISATNTTINTVTEDDDLSF
jgi:hypothetical protein